MKAGTREYYAWWRENHRESRRQTQAAYRKSSKGVEAGKAYDVRVGRISGREFQIVIISALKQLIRETRHADSIFHKLLLDAERTERKGIERAKRAFLTHGYRVFQPATCPDCGTEFHTLYPPELIAFNIVCCGVVRCRGCANQRNLKNYGGGPRRRCKHFGVPYEVINPGYIFSRDKFNCKLCGGDLDMAAHYLDPAAPEIDHIIPLSVPGSPGHVLSNVQSACRECSGRKGNRI